MLGSALRLAPAHSCERPPAQARMSPLVQAGPPASAGGQLCQGEEAKVEEEGSEGEELRDVIGNLFYSDLRSISSKHSSLSTCYF